MDYLKTRQEIRVALGELGALATEFGEPMLAEVAAGEGDRLDNGTLMIVVCGEIKMGKSSLINAMIGIEGLAPTDFDIATATAILVRQGDELAAFIIPEETAEPIPIPLSDVPRYASDQVRGALDALPRAVVIEAPSPFLAGGLTLADTPGLGGLKRSHSEVTFGMMAQADLVLFASDAQSPLTVHELDFIMTRILPLNSSFALVQTKADQQADIGLIVRENAQKLREKLGRDAPILVTSSRNKFDFERSGNPRDLADSGFEVLDRFVSETLRAKGQARIIQRGANAAVDIADKMLEPRRAELMGLEGPGSAEYVELTEELTKARDDAERLQRDHEKWKHAIRSELDDLHYRAIDKYLAHRLFEIDTEFQMQASNPNALGSDLEKVALGVEEDFRHATVTAFRQIADGVENVRISLASQIGIPLSTVVRGPAPSMRAVPRLDTERATGRSSKLGDWMAQWRRQLLGGTQLGAWIGGVIGGAVGFFAGGVGVLPGILIGANLGAGAGAVTGAGSGIFSANKYLREKKIRLAREMLVQQLQPYIKLASREADSQCRDLIAELKEALVAEFELRLEERLIEISQQEEGLSRGLAAAREGMEARKSSLAAELDRLDAPRRRVIEALAGFIQSA